MYVIASTEGNRTYVGVTKNLVRRLRQHSGELCGGAKSTAGRKWVLAALVEGFNSDGHALSFEKSMHVNGRHLRSLGNRLPVVDRRLLSLKSTLETSRAISKNPVVVKRFDWEATASGKNPRMVSIEKKSR
jgi:predicted GIY-YIG superfamily endonuclease